MRRSRKPVWGQLHRGFESHSLRHSPPHGPQRAPLPVAEPRRVARVDDWARLEIVCARKGTVGSNPTLSAKLHGRAAPSECLKGLGEEPVLA